MIIKNGNQVLEGFLSDHPGRDFDCRGLRLHYIDEGQGEPVVMVHGNPTWSFLYRQLDRVAARLASGDRAGPYRLRTFGEAR